ncbi:MAG: hypothetical protein IPP49_05525 [Saprospiraceae bacterium]|nr:hypothetical protein [Saprospiraceae bacterium]
MYKINHINGDCVESDNTVEGAVPAIGPEGQIYNKSNDQGTTWQEEETKIDPISGAGDGFQPRSGNHMKSIILTYMT